MILHLPPGSPPLAHAAADLVLALHIGGGCLAIASGSATLILPKGGGWHRVAGNMFVMSMLVMAGIGAVVSPMMGTPGNAMGGVLAVYLVLTGWLAVKRPANAVDRFDYAVPLLSAGVAVAGVYFGLVALNSPTGTVDGVPAPAPFIMASLAIFAAALDVRVIRRGGVAGPQRLARHLWRLSAALLMADFSLFLGQPKVFPQALRGSPIMFLPELFALGLMIYWLTRVRLREPPRRGFLRPPFQGEGQRA